MFNSLGNWSIDRGAFFVFGPKRRFASVRPCTFVRISSTPQIKFLMVSVSVHVRITRLLRSKVRIPSCTLSESIEGGPDNRTSTDTGTPVYFIVWRWSLNWYKGDVCAKSQNGASVLIQFLWRHRWGTRTLVRRSFDRRPLVRRTINIWESNGPLFGWIHKMAKIIFYLTKCI